MATTLDNFFVKKDDLKLERPATFEELGMDPQNKGIISVFLEFVRAEELCKSLGMNDKLNCLVCHSPGTDKSSIIAAMANYLGSTILLKNLRLGSKSLHTLPDSFRILTHLSLNECNLSHLPIPSEIGNLVSLKTLSLEGSNICALPDSIFRLTRLEYLNLADCTRLRLRIIRKRCTGGNKLAENDFANPLPKQLHRSKLMLSGLSESIHGLLSSWGIERIVIRATNHNHIDRVDAALLHPLNIDSYIHTLSLQPIAIPDGGEIVQLDSSERKPLEDFDATSNMAYQSDILVSNSERKSTREASRRQCMPQSVLSLVDSTTRISSTDFNAPNNSARLVRADQSGPIGFNSENKDLGEGLNRECLTKSLLSLDDSSRQKLLPDVEATKNKAYFFIAYQKDLVVSLSENKNKGEALQRECITKSILGLEDLQQHFGGRRDDAAKNFGAIYDPGIHTTDSLAQKSFKAVETLPTREQPNDCVPLLSIERLTPEGWEQQKKSPNLPRVLQINVVEQRVTKLPICLEGLTAESASSSHWPFGLPDGRHIVLLDPLEQYTKNVAHAAWVDQCSPTVSLPEKKMVRKTLKKKCRTVCVIFESHQQHFGGRSEGSTKSFCATHIGGKHGTNRLSIVKRIHKQHAIHQWPFRQKWATRKGYSAGGKRSFEVSSLSMNEKLDSRIKFIHMSQCAKADENDPTVSNSEKRSMREALKRDSLMDLLQHFGARRKDAVKGLCDSLAWKSSAVLDSLSLGNQSYNIRHFARRRTLTHKHCVRLKKSQDCPRSLVSDCSGELAAQSAFGLPDGGHITSLPEKKTVRKTLKRKSRTMSVLSLENHQQHVGRRWEDDAKFLGTKRICRQLATNRRYTEKRIRRQHGTRRCQFKQSAIDLTDGGHILSLSKKKIVRKTLKRKSRNISVLRSEYHQHVDRKWEDAVKSLGAKHIYRQLVMHRVSRAKRICGQLGFHRWPFQRNWETMKAYSVRDKRPAEVLSLSTDGKLVSRLQLVHISWLVKFLPRPSAYRGGGEIVGPIALLSSEFAATNNRAHGIRNDQSGSSSASHFEEEIPGEPVDVEGTGSGISLEELQQLFDKKREDAAKSLKVSVSTFKRICRQHGIKPWPYQARKKAVKKPPDRHRGMNTTGSSDDRRNLSASQEEPLLRGHVSGPIYGTISSCTDPAPSQTTPIVPHPMGNLEDQRNLLALPEELLLSQRTPSIPPAMDGFAYWGDVSALFDDSFPEGHASGSLDCTAPACSNPAPSQTMPTNATEMQNMDFVELKATYDDATFGNTTIKFQLPPKFETSELEEKVSKILKCELDSFRVEYKDKDEEWILMGCDENVREYLQLLNSLGNQVTKLKITKVPNTNLCETCGSSLTRKRPRHV